MQAQLGTVNAPLAPNGEGPSPAPTMALRPEYKLSNLTYDKNGNLQTLKRGGQSTQLLDDLSYNYATDHDHKVNNRLGSVTDAVSTSTASNFDFPNGQATDNYGYNGIGQLTKDALENRYFSYFANGRVKGVYSDAAKSVALATYTYDAGGNRLMKESYATDGVTPVERTWYLRDAGGTIMCQRHQALIELTDTDELPIAGVGSYMRGNGKVRYTLTDQLGNTRVSFTATSTGDLEIIEAHDYYPHGGLLPGRQLVGAAGSPLSYQGQEYDQEVGLTAFNLRQYDARLGRWLTTDPNGQHYSPYLAMSNNPVSFVDPDGGFDYDRDGWSEEALKAEAYYQSNREEYQAWANWVNFGDRESNYSYGADAMSGQNADGSVRDMDGMIQETMMRYFKRNPERYSKYLGSTVSQLENGQYQVAGNIAIPGSGEGVEAGIVLDWEAEDSDSYTYWSSEASVSTNSGESGTQILDVLQTGLDVVGLIPGVGEIADGINALIYTGRGDYVNAGLSAAAMIPFAGWAATGGKLGMKAAKSGANLSTAGASLSRHLGQLEKYGQGGFKELQNGRIRYYGKVKSARDAGEMQGARMVRE